MRKTTLLTFVLMLVASSFATAQEKKLTIDDIYSTDPKVRVPFSGRPVVGLRWTPDGGSYLQTRVENGKPMLMRVDAKTGNASAAYNSAGMTEALTGVGLTAEQAQQIANDGRFDLNSSQNTALLNHGNDLYVYNFANNTARRLTNSKDEEREADFSPNGGFVSFVRGNNLYVVSVAGGQERQLTSDGNEKTLNGILDWVYEEELYGRGNKRGYFWSPDSARIAFLKTDETPVQNFVVVNHQGLYQDVENTPYPKSGAPNPTVKLAVVSANGGNVLFVDNNKYKPEDFLISRIAWSPDSSRVVYQAQNREQTFLELNAANTNDGKITTLLRESSPAWVEVIDNATYLKDGSFIWQSARSGFKHLYHFAPDGKLIRQITNGKWEVRDFAGVDERNEYAYFTATERSPIGVDAYRIKLDGTGLKRLTETAGSHNIAFSPTFTHFIDYFSDINTPTQTRLYRTDGTLERVISENKVDVLGQYKLGKPEFVQVKTRDGFTMEAMRILPPDFDPNKKYPVWSYTYAGPHAQQVRNAWGGATYLWHQMLAQNGYIIWICDNRTASAKGVESEYGLYKNFGESELRDIEDGFSYLKSQPYVDGNRIGMWGWSFGGFMTSYAMTHSNTFKIGIAGGSVTDWALYDSIYTERYMGTPQTNPEGYKKSSVLAAAPNLSGKLMLIHGTIDDNVHLQNTLQFAYELQKNNKQFQLMLYPTQRHGVSNPAQLKHMRQAMTDFIMQNL